MVAFAKPKNVTDNEVPQNGYPNGSEKTAGSTIGMNASQSNMGNYQSSTGGMNGYQNTAGSYQNTAGSYQNTAGGYQNTTGSYQNTAGRNYNGMPGGVSAYQQAMNRYQESMREQPTIIGILGAVILILSGILRCQYIFRAAAVMELKQILQVYSYQLRYCAILLVFVVLLFIRKHHMVTAIFAGLLGLPSLIIVLNTSRAILFYGVEPYPGFVQGVLEVITYVVLMIFAIGCVTNKIPNVRKGWFVPGLVYILWTCVYIWAITGGVFVGILILRTGGGVLLAIPGWFLVCYWLAYPTKRVAG